MTSKPPPTTPLLDGLVATLDRYFEHLGEAKPHALHAMVIEATERPLIEYVLQHTGGRLAESAAVLGLSRTTLRKKMRDYQISFDSESQA